MASGSLKYCTINFLLHTLMIYLVEMDGISGKLQVPDSSYWIRRLPLQMQSRVRQPLHSPTENDQITETRVPNEKHTPYRPPLNRQTIYPFGWPDILGDKRAPIFVGRRLVPTYEGAEISKEKSMDHDEILLNYDVINNAENEEEYYGLGNPEAKELDAGNPDFTFNSYKIYRNDGQYDDRDDLIKQQERMAHWRVRREATSQEKEDISQSKFLRNSPELNLEAENLPNSIFSSQQKSEKMKEISTKFFDNQAKNLDQENISPKEGNNDSIKQLPTQPLETNEKRAPKFVGKREEIDLYHPDNDKIDLTEVEFEDNFAKRRAPGFVGKRLAPRYVGKRRIPNFVGKRPAPGFVGKRISSDLLESLETLEDLEKRLAPSFVGKRRVPGFVGKRRAPGFVGKRPAPGFVGKRPAPGFVGKRRVPGFVGKRFEDHISAERLTEISELLNAEEKRAAPAFVGK